MLKLQRKHLLCSMLLITSATVHAEVTIMPHDIVAKFFSELSHNKPEQAIDGLMDTNPEIKKEISQIDTLKAQFKNYPTTLGDYQFNELLCHRKIGKHLINDTYLVGYKKSPMLFEFIFYNAKKTWKIKNINTNDFNIDYINNNSDWCNVEN